MAFEMNKEIENGDYVVVKTVEDEFKGIMIPRPDLLDQNFIVIKLDSGYNIGIEKEKIESIELLEKYKPKEEVPRKELKFNDKLKTVSILSFGGTISSKIDYKTGGVRSDYTAEDFVAMIPELEDMANIKTRKALDKMSEDLDVEDWQFMADEIKKALEESDGVVVSQGTDTLHYSTAAISFFIRNLEYTNKPVIFTASQKSIDRGSSDAFMNLKCAVSAAANLEKGVVATCLHGTSSDDYCLIIRGSKVRKMHTSRRDAFRPINDEYIAKVFVDGKLEFNENTEKFTLDSSKEIFVDNSFEKKTALISVYPGMDPEIIDFYVNKGYRGIVLSATALGHVPTDESKNNLLEKLKNARSKGVVICIASQTLYGRTNKYVYTNLRKLGVMLDCVFMQDMSPETAYIKLGWVLGSFSNNSDFEKIKSILETNIVGEINKRHSPKMFLN